MKAFSSQAGLASFIVNPVSIPVPEVREHVTLSQSERPVNYIDAAELFSL